MYEYVDLHKSIHMHTFYIWFTCEGVCVVAISCTTHLFSHICICVYGYSRIKLDAACEHMLLHWYAQSLYAKLFKQIVQTMCLRSTAPLVQSSFTGAPTGLSHPSPHDLAHNSSWFSYKAYYRRNVARCMQVFYMPHCENWELFLFSSYCFFVFWFYAVYS